MERNEFFCSVKLVKLFFLWYSPIRENTIFKAANYKFLLPLVLAVLIGIIVSFAVQGFISFVSFVESYLRGDEHLLLGLPKELLVISGPIIAGIIVSIITTLHDLRIIIKTIMSLSPMH